MEHSDGAAEAGRGDPMYMLPVWYEECVKSHEQCRSVFNEESYFPARLIDIGRADSVDSIRLVTTMGDSNFTATRSDHQRPAYATLSHCWGKSQPLKLLTHNEGQLKQGIDRANLPRVFLDAIDVCRRLSIQYLWIDSLCICQDSEEDWSKESALMGKTYSTGVINIGATGCADSNCSLFERDSSGSASVGLITWAIAPANKYVVVENSICWLKDFLDQPLLRRAWVVQERLLATRMVHFTKSGLMWECRSLAATDTYPRKVPDVLQHVHHSRNRFWQTDPPGQHKDEAWSNLVQNYSNCALTFGKDKLIALSGLVSTMKTGGLDRGNYWVGMWETDFPYCLVWVRSALDRSKWRQVRPNEYRAPSWSWASLDCQVWTAWSLGIKRSPVISHFVVNEDGGKGQDGPQVGCRLLLYMTGPLAKVSIVPKGSEVETVGRGIERAQGISYCISSIYQHREDIEPDAEFTYMEDDTWNEVIFDDFNDSNLTKDVWCAPIFECEMWKMGAGMRLFGLLLEVVEGNTFRRIGTFSVRLLPNRQLLKRLQSIAYTVI
ncbi:HET-domain-containing protein [Aaosphaeria arxii CBS 175.79]|uniref:HET-domain-containing protein n=1 Tax=Aaosphaeria arxii CBS 175.79 TaxID=1450172 RepID=A0A6A5XML1_9PLEO|nr:HET-domain-containing protein [Aaosphaeria arxii CBS 175.79]KAF2014485.1 HET-domain-containing protein [Aaosphaeria arxii CBS 175.79]